MKWLIRIAAAFAVLLVAAVAVLALMGQREGANRLEAAITIARPPQAVWPFLYEEEKLKQWVSWLEEAKPSAEPAVGKRGTWVMRDQNSGGQLIKIESLVTAAEPARLLAVSLTGPGFTGEGVYRFIAAGADGQSTRLETRQTYRFDQWFVRLLAPVVLPAAAEKTSRDLERLKVAVEKQLPATASN